MSDDAIDAVADLSVHAHALLKEAAKWTSAVSVTLSKLRAASASSHPQQSSNDESTGSSSRSVATLEQEIAALRERNVQLTAAIRLMETRVHRIEERASKLATAHHKVSVKYMRAMNERNSAVVRFWNWLSGHVSIIGLEHVVLLTDAWDHECRWTSHPNGALSNRMDEFKASTGVFILTTAPATAPASLPLPEWKSFGSDDGSDDGESDRAPSGDETSHSSANADGDPAAPPRATTSTPPSNGKAKANKRGQPSEDVVMKSPPTKRHCPDSTVHVQTSSEICVQTHEELQHPGHSAEPFSPTAPVPPPSVESETAELPSTELPIGSPATVQPAPPSAHQPPQNTPIAQVPSSNMAMGRLPHEVSTSEPPAAEPFQAVTSSTEGTMSSNGTAVETTPAPPQPSVSKAAPNASTTPGSSSQREEPAAPVVAPTSAKRFVHTAPAPGAAVAPPSLSPAAASAIPAALALAATSKKPTGVMRSRVRYANPAIQATADRLNGVHKPKASRASLPPQLQPSAVLTRAEVTPVPDVCPPSVANELEKIRLTKPWLKYSAVGSFLPEKDPTRSPRDTAAVQTFNKYLTKFWTSSAALLWNCRFSWTPNRAALSQAGDNVVLLMGHFQRLMEDTAYNNGLALIEFLARYPHPAWPVMTTSFMPLRTLYSMHGEAAVVSFLHSQGHKLWPEYPPPPDMDKSPRPPPPRRHSIATTTPSTTKKSPPTAAVEWRWALGATFAYVANRKLTKRQLDMLAELRLQEEPATAFRHMAKVAKEFIKRKCPDPAQPYPFVAVTVLGHLVGPQWSHGKSRPRTQFAVEVPDVHAIEALRRLADEDDSSDDEEEEFNKTDGTSKGTAIDVASSSSGSGDEDDEDTESDEDDDEGEVDDYRYFSDENFNEFADYEEEEEEDDEEEDEADEEDEDEDEDEGDNQNGEVRI